MTKVDYASAMRLSYDPRRNLAYIRLRPATAEVETVRVSDEILRRGAARSGLTWHFARPPVLDLDYEMDCRSVSIERVV